MYHLRRIEITAALCWICLLEYIHAATLTVQPFKFVEGLTKGQTATVLCAVLDQPGPFVFRWTRDGGPLSNHPLTKVQSTEEYSLLNLRSLDRSRSGKYTCSVTSETAHGNYSTELVVYEQPEWSVVPEDTSVVAGQNVRVECNGTGYPTPNTTWLKYQENKTVISTRLFQRSGNPFSINNVQESDAGQYQCVVSNGIGENLTKIISIIVHVPPHFREDYQLLRVRSSHSVTMQCEVSGDHPLSVKWSSEYQPDGIESRHKIQQTPLPKGQLSELFITRATRLDAGLYLCRATNPYGQKERTVKLIVLEPPSPPSDIVIKQIGSDEITLRWTAPYSGNSPIVRYILQYWKDTGTAPKLEEQTVPNQKTSVVLTGLHPGTPYVIRMMAENEFGQSSPSIPVKFTTAEEKPSGYPTDISVVQQGGNSLLVRWKPVSAEQRNGVVKSYEVGYRNRNSLDQFTFHDVPAARQKDRNGTPGTFQEYTLDTLEANTVYEVVVRALNSAGKGPASVPVSSNTRDKNYLPTLSLWVESVSSNSLTLRWTKSDKSTDFVEYKLFYRLEGGDWEETSIKYFMEDSYVIEDLPENSSFELYLQGVGVGDIRSDPSPTIKASTSDPSFLRSPMARDGGEEKPNSGGGMTVTMVISLSVVISTVLIVCVVAGACVYVVRIRTRAQFKADEMGSRHLTEQHSASECTRMSTNFRYVDVNSRPMMWCSTPAPPPLNDYPSPYATLPLRGTPLSKRWQSEGDGALAEAQSERSESLINQRLEQVEEKTPSCHD